MEGEVAPKRKYKGRDKVSPYIPELWEATYLEVLGRRGNMSTAAKMAGTTNRVVKLRRETSPEFAAQWTEAMDAYLDSVEEDLGALKNPIAKIARLRADRPERYLEKHQLAVAGTVLHGHVGVPPEELTALLKVMLSDVRPESRAQLTGEVIDVTPVDADRTDQS